MPITTLQNTRWEFNNTIDFQGHSGTFNIYFETISGSVAFTSIRIDYSTQEIYYVGIGGDTLAYGYDDIEQTYAWFDNDLQQIKITGGTDVETSDLIYFITDNATELPIPTYNITYHLTKLSTVGAPNTIQEDATETLRIIVASGYEDDYRLPTNITVTGCDYNYAGGYVDLYNAYSDVDIWAEAEEIPTYSITFNLTNLTHTGATTIRENGTADCTLIANTGYLLPNSIEVTGASYSYSRVTGEVALDMPTGNVTITARGGANPSSLGITFYRQNCENIRVDKSEYLTQVAYYTGTLREETSLISPTIRIATDVFQPCNYAYIGDFGRYYYITDIVSVRKGLWEVSLSCDVLMTYRLGIKDTNAIVSRNEFEYDNKIIDERVLFKADDEITQLDVNLVTSPINFAGNITRYQYIINSACEDGLLASSAKINKITNTNHKYVLNYSNLLSFTEEMQTSSFADALTHLFENNPVEAILSIKAYPFIIPHGNVDTQMKIGNYRSSVNGRSLSVYTNYEFEVGRFNIPSISWISYVADYSLYLPCFGFVTLDASQIVDKYISIRYEVDFDTGQCLARVLSSDDNSFNVVEEIYRTTFGIGIDIPVSQTNAQDLARNLITTGIVMASLAAITVSPALLSVPSSVGMVAGSVIENSTASSLMGTVNPALTGAVTSAKNIPINVVKGEMPRVATGYLTARGIQQQAPHIYRGTNNGNSGLGLYSSENPYIIMMRKKPIYPTNYYHVNGAPLYQTKSLGSVSGYTECINVRLESTQFNSALYEERESVIKQLESGVIL